MNSFQTSEIPKISIITVTFNAQDTLERTLQSVERQSGVGLIEHIIIDGASKDSTLKMISDYEQHNCQRYTIKVKSEPDRGLYDAMNKGIGMATGEFIVFLNAGDCLHSVSTIAETFSGNTDGFGVIYGDTDIVDGEGHFLRKRRLSPPEDLNSDSFRDGMLVCHQSFYARRSLVPQYDLRYRFSADVDWCIRVLMAGEASDMVNHYTHTVLTDYLEEGMTTRNHRASLIERFNVMRHHYGLCPTILRHIKFLFRK